ncbi:hypothetical protein D3C73_1517110 [compost metagenome]
MPRLVKNVKYCGVMARTVATPRLAGNDNPRWRNSRRTSAMPNAASTAWIAINGNGELLIDANARIRYVVG